MGYKCKEVPFTLYIGIDISFPNDVTQLINLNSKLYDFLSMFMIHPNLYRNHYIHMNQPLTRSDLMMTSDDWSFLIGKINYRFINFDCNSENIINRSIYIMRQEISLAIHLGTSAIFLPPIPNNLFQYAQILNQFIEGGGGSFIVPIKPDQQSWDNFSLLKKLCGYKSGLKVCLELPADLPEEEEVLKWISEKIGYISISVELFLTNNHGFPVLSKAHQNVLKKLFKYCPYILLKPRHPSDSLENFRDYICHLFRTHATYSYDDKVDYDYKDYLQSPLQPLMNNLQSTVYETFEKDAAKYQQYKLAIQQALVDYSKFGRFYQIEQPPVLSHNNAIQQRELIIMVLGAGRGPLVRCAFEASQNANVPIRVYAIEKNINCINTLKNIKISEIWGNKFTIVETDMREFQPQEKADIIVSELLGSFGDNELSPECLYPTQRFLRKKIDSKGNEIFEGIYIPYKYISYAHPVNSSVLWKSVQSANQFTANPYEVGYVVRVYSANYLDDCKPVFMFNHPAHSNEQNLQQYSCLNFENKHGSQLVHGFVGYFDSLLYQQIRNSICPFNHTLQLYSWFPIFFPIKEPLEIEEGDQITINMWRTYNNQKIWYEWAVGIKSANTQRIRCTFIHNTQGRAYSIGLH